jgi:sugar-specific transcriptional regulator TrmB
MAESRDMRKKIEHLVERSQREIVEASRNLSSGFSKRTERLVMPVSNDIERMVDDVFDFAERVVNSQRRMVSEVVKAINEQADRAVDAGRTATGRMTKRAPAKKAAAKRAPAKKAAAKKQSAGTSDRAGS